MASTTQSGIPRGDSTPPILFVAPLNQTFCRPCYKYFSNVLRRPRPRQESVSPPAFSPLRRVRPQLCVQTASQYQTTDNHAEYVHFQALQITEDNAQIDVRQESLNLLEWPQISAHVLRHASTPQGRAALYASSTGLQIPDTRSESERLLAETREAYLLEYTLFKPLDFSGVYDVSTLVGLARKGKVLYGKQLVSVAETLAAARKIRRHLESAASPNATEHPHDLSILKGMVSSFRTWPEAERSIMKCIDEFGDVADSADPELRGIRNSLRDAMSDVRGKLNDIMARHSEAIQDRVITSRYDRFVIPVKISRKSAFKRGTVHDVSASGSTAYIEPASVRPLNDRLRQLTAKEKAKVNAILRRLSVEVVAPIADDIYNISRILAKLDAATARARYSRSLDAVDVVFDDDKPLRLIGARHPLLSGQAMAALHTSSTARSENPTSSASEDEAKDRAENRGKGEPAWKAMVVPSSYILDEEVRCVCVTGPNTGGKTLSLKTLGTCVLMAKAGLFVPARNPNSIGIIAKEYGLKPFPEDEYSDEGDVNTARLPFFDAVLADIGDDQSLVQSLSTFSGHIRRIKRILGASSKRSLVLLDEIGSGTDPAEGAALGMAILRHLAIGNKAALTFATTHHGELKTLKYSNDNSARFFENASVEFDDLRMAPTFKLVWGIPGRSNALAIASRLGLAQEVLNEAHYLLTGTSKDGQRSSKRVDIEKMILSLEREKNSAESAREDAESRLHEIEQLRFELNERLERLRESEKSLREDQKRAMESEVKDAKKQIARVIKEMQQGGGSAQAASRASDKLGNLRLPGADLWNAKAPGQGPSDQHVDIKDVQIGDRVVVPRLSPNEVEIVEVASRKEVVVAFGGMKAKVKVKEIGSLQRRRQVSRAEEPSMSHTSELATSGAIIRTAANTIDIRGERVEGAESRVEKAIDKGLAMGAIWVIHGHGTGRLRHGIRQFLNGHPMVQRIEEAEQSEGGSGVTIAYLG